MSLKDRITDDMKAAMRAQDAPRLLTIRGLLAAIKQRKDSIEQFTAGSRQDLVDKERAELQVLESYLPARLGADEIGAEVAALVAETGASGAADMGKVMAAAKARFAGRAEMGQVSAAVKAALAR